MAPGDGANFQGYISKFMSSREAFRYSLKEVRDEYIFGKLREIMGFEGKNYDWMNEIPVIPQIQLYNGNRDVDITFLKCLAVMKRMANYLFAMDMEMQEMPTDMKSL